MSPGFIRRNLWNLALLLAGAAAALLAAYATRDRLANLLSQPPERTVKTAEHDEEAGHNHDHAGHEEGNSLELSNQARSNIGLKLATIELRPFEKTITVPGIITEKPGRTIVEITAPMTGVVTQIAALHGEAVEPGQLLAEMRLTHEELVQAQGDLLRTAESLDVTNREITRVERLTRDGAIAGKTLIDLNYEKQKAEAILRAQSQTLVLHGLSEKQVADILETRKLLQKLSIAVPTDVASNVSQGVQQSLQVQELRVERGQHVTAGDVLFVLADHQELFIEGRAFEQDVQAVSNAVAQDWKVSASLENKSGQSEGAVTDLSVAFMANKVDPESRAFRFYVTLPNRILRETKAADGRKYLDWEFKPGQRVQIHPPLAMERSYRAPD